VSAIRIFCFEGHLASRCTITSNVFYESPLRAPVTILGGQSWAATALVISVLHHVSLFVDRTRLLLVSVKTAEKLQLLQTRCIVIQITMNRSRRVSVLNVVQFLKDPSVLKSFWLIAGHLHFDKPGWFFGHFSVIHRTFCEFTEKIKSIRS